jgi:hypothetical protein
MTSKRERILAAYLEALTESEHRPEEATVHRFPLRPLELDQLPAVAIYARPVDMNPSERVERRELGVNPPERRILTLRCEGRAMAASNEAPETAVDPLFQFIVKAVHEAGGLNGLLLRLPREMESGYAAVEGEEGVYSAIAVDFEIEYETTRGNPDN